MNNKIKNLEEKPVGLYIIQDMFSGEFVVYDSNGNKVSSAKSLDDAKTMVALLETM